ncbi:MAG: glycosyl hydrolase 115 family protein [Lachnospiraceae bacterium]|nr:glycosyl hydrolase 115 family protein [Lachnospiraceae bacterium]
MSNIKIENSIPIIVETNGYEGVKRIAEAVAGDFEKVTGKKPECISQNDSDKLSSQVILCATLGKSDLVDKLIEEGKITVDEINGKREVFMIKLLKKPFENCDNGLRNVDDLVLICGSDKRGTIYGMFTLSEYIGVTALTYWGDSAPLHKDVIEINHDIEQISKEPSVRYRGFFINDEWPCFGNWVVEHFGGFNAKAYKEVFEFLLRMKGNYLWPAMWSASFPIDGPEGLNEELADIYGVVMGYSHHEPCLRASEEWDKVRGVDTKYGNEWNFYTNEKGLLNYWGDALKRSGKYENIVTIGMRGERDSSMLGENATVKENVNLLKDIIKKQRELIAKNVNANVDEVPQMIALYKEVEQYFYGNDVEGDTIEGLKNYKELENVICMLCEDNFGHMRTLPTEDIRNRKGGFGMYYHLDYHGGPISYEWVDSTPLSKIWEQMSMAYEYGIKDLWIVNVGDLKLHEVPLTYFMALAYDYDKWGYSNKQSYKEYTALWAKKNFPSATEEQLKGIEEVFTEYIRINSLRRPEALNEKIYSAYIDNEADNMLKLAQKIETLSETVYSSLSEADKQAYYSMVHFSAKASMNLIKMHLYAAKNRHYANQGRPVANKYADLVNECIRNDREFIKEFADFKAGKWNGMQLAAHIGFTKWNEDGYKYPVICRVEPVNKPRMSVSRRDSMRIACKNYGAPEAIEVKDFMYPGVEEVVIEIANDGCGILDYEIIPENGILPEWLIISELQGQVTDLTQITLKCDYSKISPQNALHAEKEEYVRLLVKDNDTCVALDVYARNLSGEGLPEMTFMPSIDGIIIGAEHFCDAKPTDTGSFEIIENYGKYNAGVKVFPSTAVYGESEDKPEVTYSFVVEQAGEYVVELLTAPANSVVNKQSVNVMIRNGKESDSKIEIIPDNFRAGESSDVRWAMGVLNQIRSSKIKMNFDKGINTITIGALEAGVVLERIRIYSALREDISKSYLGPDESRYTN